MPDPRLRPSDLEDRLDRHARGELTAVEARELAQKSLDDPDLFEDLTYSALAKKAVSDTRFPRKTRFVFMSAAAAAAILAISLYFFRPSYHPSRIEPASTPSAQPSAATPLTHGQPILIGSVASMELRAATTFRGVDSDSRPPKATGSIVSSEGGEASIDLGSLDGLAQSNELQVFRGAQPTSIGRVVVTTVFRERARGRIVEGQIRVNDQVRVDGATHLAALLDQADALSARGQAQAARSMAETAVTWTENVKVARDERLKALDKLASLEYQAGLLDQADAHYRSIVPWATGILLAQSENNLGALAELRGERPQAEKQYTAALRTIEDVANAPVKDRAAIETNLARIRGSR
jgi:tetratricopeptide (TPR) repeat protein